MNKVLALALTEARLLLRNRTIAVSAIVLPLALGVFFIWNLGSYGDAPQLLATAIAVQLATVIGSTVYATTAQILVSRRYSGVLKRMRTSGISDGGLLVATIAPGVAVAVVQLLLFLPINAAIAAPTVADPLPLVLAAVGGLALAVAAALATTLFTSTPDRAQITTLPLLFVLLGAAIFAVVAPQEGWWQAVIAVPGVAIGQLAEFALAGGTWSAGLGGLPAVLPALIALVVWPVVFAVLAHRGFRWDTRRG